GGVARAAGGRGARRRTWRWRTTLSTKYLVEAGSTRPETRLTAIKPKPRISRPRRGFISAQTSGRFFHAFLRFFSFEEALSLEGDAPACAGRLKCAPT